MRTAFILIVTATLLIQFSTAKDYKNPHRFKAGDVLSADVLNELFDSIERRNKTVTAADIVGTWDAVMYNHGHRADGDHVGIDSLVYYKTITLTVKDDGDGTYSWESYPYSAFDRRLDYNDKLRLSGKCIIVDGRLFGNYDVSPDSRFQCPIQRISETRIMIENERNGHSGTYHMVCNKRDLPPEIPTNLRLEKGELVWDDVEGEDGYTVLTRDTLEGEWRVHAKTGPNVNYLQIVDPNQWYRIKSYSDKGDSLAGNVVKK